MSISEFMIANSDSLFTASITVGTFVFTMKSFIIQTMKKEVYEKKLYRKFYTQTSNFNKTGKDGIYAPLRKLSRALTICISMALTNAFILISGASSLHPASAWIAFIFNILTWSALAFSVWIVTENIKKMLDFSEWENKLEDEQSISSK